MQLNRTLGLPAYAFVGIIALGVVPAMAGSYTYKTLRIAGQQASYAYGINDKDQVAGGFVDAGGLPHGLVWDKGTYTQVDGPGATHTSLGPVNARGVAVGDYYTTEVSDGVAFTYDIATGQQQMLKIKPNYIPYANGINVKGAVVGQAVDTENGPSLGFVGKANGGNVRLLTFPGSTGTAAYGINDSGAVVGVYFTPGGAFSGFLYQSDSYASIDPPHSINSQVLFITDDGILGGSYTDKSGQTHGFTMSGGAFTIYEYPEATGSTVVGVGPSGEVVGNWTDSSDATHGFVNLGGAYYTIDKPGASATVITAVSTKGSLVGIFTEHEGRAFIAKCPTEQRPCTQ